MEKAKFIMTQCDLDGNGVLDRQEFRELAQRFPNLVYPKF